MSDGNYSLPEPPPIALGDALRALPLATPPGSAWQRLQRQLPPPRRARRWPFALALAASIAAIGLLPAPLLTPPAPPVADQSHLAASTADAKVIALQQESAQLEAWLGAIGDGSVRNAEAADASGRIVDRVQWIDALLAAADRAETRQALWQERVLLLRRLALIEGRSQWLAAAGDGQSNTPLLSL